MIHHAYLQASTSLRHGTTSPCKHARRLPIIGMVCMLMCSIGLIIGENVHPVLKWRIVDESGNWEPYGNVWLHCSMAMFFGLYSVVNLLKHTCLPSAAKFEMIIASLAFGVEGFIFVCHIVLPDNNAKKGMVPHVLLLIPIFVCFFATLCEVFTKNYLLKLSYIRTVAILQQGTWFMQMAFILFKNPWGDEAIDHEYAAVFFSWHLFVNILLLIVVYNVTALIVRQCRSLTSGNGASYSLLDKERDADIGMDDLEEKSSCLQA